MSALAEKVAREHIATSTTSGLGCTCGGWTATYTHGDPTLTGLDQHRAHIAAVTEAAVRERVARDIVQRQLVSTDTAAILAYDDAARIARGGVA